MKPSSGWKTDIAIIGGGLGGVSAALAALRLGQRVVLVEALQWLGGQLTAQGVPPDEYPWIESVHASQSYAQLRAAIRAYYRDHLPLTQAAFHTLCLNPGQGNVSTLCHEPWVAARVIDALLAPWEQAGRLRILRGYRVLRADTEGDRVLALHLRELDSGHDGVLQAPIFIDATETGELLDMAGVEHVMGAEAQSDTQEPHALPHADPMDQ